MKYKSNSLIFSYTFHQQILCNVSKGNLSQVVHYYCYLLYGPLWLWSYCRFI